MILIFREVVRTKLSSKGMGDNIENKLSKTSQVFFKKEKREKRENDENFEFGVINERPNENEVKEKFRPPILLAWKDALLQKGIDQASNSPTLCGSPKWVRRKPHPSRKDLITSGRRISQRNSLNKSSLFSLLTFLSFHFR